MARSEPWERPEPWVASPQRLPDCGLDHHGARGTYDETARRVDHPELAAAEMLVADGHAVRSVPVQRGHPTADFEVCGRLVEVKTLIAQELRMGGRPANERSTFNRLMSGKDQAPLTILMAEGSGLRAADAAAGVRRFAARGDTGKTRAVRVVGDGWDLAWSAPPVLDRRPSRSPVDRGRLAPAHGSRARSDPARTEPARAAPAFSHPKGPAVSRPDVAARPPARRGGEQTAHPGSSARKDAGRGLG